MAARSRSSSATRSWRSSAFRPSTRTTPCARCAPPPECRRRSLRLNDELDRAWGIRLANRTGVHTGEVVAGDPTGGQRLVTGDPVNTAARLEQAAPTNEILIGELTYRLVREAVEVEQVAPLELKGKLGARAGVSAGRGQRRGCARAATSPPARRARWSAVPGRSLVSARPSPRQWRSAACESSRSSETPASASRG